MIGVSHPLRSFGKCIWFSGIVIFCLAVEPLAAGTDDPLMNLRAAHPRLMVPDERIKQVQALVQSNKQAGDAFTQLKKQGDKLLDQPVVQHVLIGPRLLAQSRQALQVISTCAGLYRLTGDVRYADRARKEMLAVAAFDDWNPPHFLDVAEMTNACGIGYDWTYDQLSPEDRTTIRMAIIDKGLKPGLDAYAKHEFWTDCNYNWGQVCAGGLAVGALSIADEQPDLARQILELTHKTIIKPMAQFAPDGGWVEGPGYWNYATSYNVFYLSAIESALGTDFGLETQPGFSETGSFHIQLTGPTKKVFNFADAGDSLESSPQMFWFAQRFNNPVYAAWERMASAGRMNIFHLLWFDPDGQWPPSDDSLPLDAMFTRVNVGVFRSSWTDPDAWFVAFKGGENGANHAHLDLGSFVLDALGQRWGVQLGGDSYNLPGYFGKARFTYYRLGTQGQNTITLDGANQALNATAKIISFVSRPERAAAIIDLPAAYPDASVRRGICLLDRKRVLIQDEVELQQKRPRPFEWNFHTPAKVQADGGKAILTLGKVQLRATILSPADAKFEVADATAPPPQNPNKGITNLMIRCDGMQARIAVLFSETEDGFVPDVTPLDAWPAK